MFLYTFIFYIHFHSKKDALEVFLCTDASYTGCHVLVHRRLIHWLPCSRFCLCFDVSFETLELTCPNFVNGGQQK